MKAEDFLNQGIKPAKDISFKGMSAKEFLGISVEEPIEEPAGPAFAKEQPPTMFGRGKEAVADFFRPSFAPEPEPERIPFSAKAPIPPSPEIPAFEHEDIISRASTASDIDSDLIRAVIDVESSGKPGAVSEKGAGGLMQIMPATAEELGITDRFDPEQNISGGTRYLKKMLDKYDGNETLALAAYNAGAGNVTKYGGVPPFKETQNYVKKVTARYKKYQEDRRKAIEPVTDSVEDFLAAGVPGRLSATGINARKAEINERLGQIGAETTTDNTDNLQAQLEGITSQAVDGTLPPDLYEQYTALRPQYEKAVEDYNVGITEAQGLTGELEDLKQQEYGAAMTRPISTVTGKPVPTPEERMLGGITEPGKYDFMDRAREIKEEGIVPFVPFISGGKEVKDVAGVAAAAYKLKEGTATPEEKADLLEFIEKANRDTTFGYKVINTVAAMPAFMGEFLLTSGLYSAGRKIGTKTATKALENYMGKAGRKVLEKDLGKIGVGIVGGVAGGTLQAPIMGAPRIVSGTIERSMPKLKLSQDEEGGINAVIAGEGEDLLVASTMALGDQWAETVSEHSGGLFRMLNGSAKNAAIRAGLFSATMKANPGMSPNKVNTLFNKMAYHGVINEMLEERVGEGLRAGLGLQEYKIPAAEQLAVELVSFSVPGVIQALGARAFREREAPPEAPPPAAPGLSETQRELAKEVIREKMAERPPVPAIPERQIPAVSTMEITPGVPPVVPEPMAELPPGQGFELIEPAPEIRLRPGPEKIEGSEYPEDAEYVVGRPAPEELAVEHKPILSTRGLPWKEKGNALKALRSREDVSPATHKVVKVKKGYGIVPLADKRALVEVEAKPEEVKGKTLIAFVRAMGGIKDKTLPGEIRALSPKETGVVGLTTSVLDKGLAFDEMASAAVEHGWLPENLDDQSGAFSEILRDDVFAQKEKKPRVERLADVAEKAEREERWKEFERAEDAELEYFAKHPNEEIDADLDEWQREAVAEIRSRNEADRARKIEENIASKVEKENPDLGRLKKDEGFSEYIEGWDEKDLLDEKVLAELEAWRAGEEVEKPKIEVPPAKEEIPVSEVPVEKPKPKKPIAKIPEFKNTEEALAFGKTATTEQIKALKAQRDKSLSKSDTLKAKGDLQGAMDEAVKGQLFREAIESAEGEVVKPEKAKEPVAEVSVKAPSPKDVSDYSGTTQSKFFSDILESKTFRTKGLSGFNVPTQRIMMDRVISTLHNSKIRDAVIKNIPVDVMNYLRRKNLTPKMFFHDSAMLKTFLAVDAHNKIPLGIDSASSLVSRTASEATELMARVKDITHRPHELFPAGLTDTSDAATFPGMKTAPGTKIPDLISSDFAGFSLDNLAADDTFDIRHGVTPKPSISPKIPIDTEKVKEKDYGPLAEFMPEKEPVLREPEAEYDKEKELKELGAKIRGDRVVLYRGGNVSKKELEKLRYNDYLSLVKEGKDATGNEGASGYGKNVIRIEVPINDIKITNGEIQYIGKAESLEGGRKYPVEIYRAYNDYHGSNYTALEIDKETDVRAVASMALEGGREEFDARLAEFMPEVKEKAEYVYHGTGEGAFRQIRKVGMKKAENYFSGDEQYAKTYAERKGVLKEPRILRIKKTADIIPDERIEEPGDFKTERGISPQEIEVKVGKKWIPIQEYYDESINIMPIEKPEAAPKPEKEPISEIKSRLIENIKSEKGSSELINDLSRLGADVMRRGYVKFKDFSAEMQRVLGEAWSKARSLMQKAFFGAKKILESEKGAVELRNPLAGQVTDESPSGMSLFDDLEVERTYAQKINTERDEAVYQVSRRAAALEKQLKQLTGTGKRKGVVGRGISAEKIKYSEFQARKLSRAMLYYREAQINPEKAEKFEGWAVEELKTARGERKIRIKAQLESYRQSQDLTDEQKRFVDETMDQAFSEVSEEAINSGIITRAKENYVRRIWDLPRNRAGLAKYGFKTFTTAQLQRKFETIYDGFVRDMDLRVSGITSSYGEIAEEIAVVKANKNFIKASMDIGILTTDSRKPGYVPLSASGFSAWARKAGAKIKTRPIEPGLLQIDTHGRKIFFAPPTLKYGAIKPGATRVSKYFMTMEMAEEWIEERRPEAYRIDKVQQADVFEKVTLYAPERIGEMLNQMTRTAGGMFQTPVMRSLLRFNAGIKGWILMSSFFHHMAGERSWAFGVNHEIADNLKKGNIVQAIKNVGTAVNSVSAHKRGLEKIEANSAQLALLVRQGLTLGKMQDWDEALLREQKGLTETFIHTLGAERIAGVMEKGRIKREMFTNSLFRRFFAGLKAEAAVTEFNHRVKRATMKGETPNADLIAEQVARLINADFGGLHLTRMGRSKDMQKMLRLLLLAPDWTESNFRTFTGMVPGANKTINRIIGDMPPPPGMEKVYRGFWGGVIIKGTLATMMAQAVADLWNDDDEGWRKDEFFNNFRRMKWTGVNITGLYRSFGVDVPENQRRIFSVVGHFADPLKIMHPPKLIKGKGSPLTRITEALMSKSDWRERPYTSFGEWAATGKLKKKSRYQPKENFWEALPSIATDQVIGMQPIQFGHLLRYSMGEEDALSALLKSGGFHITTAYKPRKPKAKKGRLTGGLSGGKLKSGLRSGLK